MDHVFPSSISLREQDQSPCHPCLSRMSKHTASIDVNTLLVARVVQAFLGFQVYREFLVSPSGLAALEHNPIEKQQQQQNKHFAKPGHKQQRGKKLRKLTRIGIKCLKLKAPLKHKFRGYFRIEKSRNQARI